jgi:hypothetical protein
LRSTALPAVSGWTLGRDGQAELSVLDGRNPTACLAEGDTLWHGERRWLDRGRSHQRYSSEPNQALVAPR